MGVPSVKVPVNGKPSRLYLDSGSRLCYMETSAAAGLTPW